MDWMNFVSIVLGLVLRIGIPAIITLLVFYWFKQLDQRWQGEAQEELIRLQKQGKMPVNIRCWEINGCSIDARSKCLAFRQQQTPCWQVFRSSDGVLKEKCLGCGVFKEAPIPIPVRS